MDDWRNVTTKRNQEERGKNNQMASRAARLTAIYVSGFKLADIPAEYARRFGLLVSLSSVRGMKFTAEQRLVHASNQVIVYSKGRNRRKPDPELQRLCLLRRLRLSMLVFPESLATLEADITMYLSPKDKDRWHILRQNFPRRQTGAELRHMLTEIEDISFEEARELVKTHWPSAEAQ